MAKKEFSLAEAMKGTIGEASAANMALGGERTLETITNEILRLKSETGEKLIAIGERLIEAKTMLSHGEWLPWLENSVEFSERTAQELMKIAREYPNPRALADLGKQKVLKLLLLPPAERDEFVETHDVVNMSTRELEQAIRERDEAKAKAEKWEEAAGSYASQVNDLQVDLLDAQKKINELEAAPKEVYQDEAAIKRAADEARKAAIAEMQDKLDKATAKARKAEEKASRAGADAGAEAEKYRAEAEQLRAELDAAKRERAQASISGDAELAAFQLLFEQVQTDVNKMRGLLLKVRARADDDLDGKLENALLALADKVRGCAE